MFSVMDILEIALSQFFAVFVVLYLKLVENIDQKHESTFFL